MKLVPTALAGAVTIALTQFAVAQTATDTRQYPTTQSPSVNAEQNESYSQRGNASYPGQENQGNPRYSQRGPQNQDRSDQYGASGGQTRDRDDERRDNGKHKGEYKRDDDDQGGRGRD